MKRCYLFLLMCLLSLQVFAGALAQPESRADQSFQVECLAADLVRDADVADAGGSLPYADSEESFERASAGDESLIAIAMAAASDAVKLADVPRSDPARDPPFLPPAGRPPRV